jgi:hypothetical protein
LYGRLKSVAFVRQAPRMYGQIVFIIGCHNSGRGAVSFLLPSEQSGSAYHRH